MKKVERINTIMRFINNRAHFTLSEIMAEFNISRSTAIRDIKEIEAMGFPLVAEVGRSGGYSVMKNTMLPTIRFTDNEVKALFIALLATKNQQLPFLKSRLTLSEKLIALLTILQQDDLVLLNEILRFQGTNPANPDLLEMSDIPHPLLDKLIQLTLTSRYLQITSSKGIDSIYLTYLYQEYGQWFIEFYDFNHETKRVLAVAALKEVVSFEPEHWLKDKEIKQMIKKKDPPYNVSLHLGPKAIAQYKKYHPFNISLSYTDPFQLTGNCRLYVDVSNETEVEIIVNWLFFLGKDLKIKACPPEITSEIRNRSLV